MKLELNIDPAQIGEDIHQVFASLTEEQKQAAAAEMIKGWLDLPYGAEREAREAKVVEELRAKNEFRGKDDWRYREALGKEPTLREKFVAMVTEQVVKYQREEIARQIKEDPQCQKVMAETLDHIKKNFGAIVHDAMMLWFVQNLNSTMSMAASSLAQSGGMQKQLEQLHQRLTSPTPY